jgi:proteasome lid subunit RPN8/RPN11
MERVFQRLRQTNDFLNCLERIDKAMSEKKHTGRQYTVSSLFLHECYKALTADRDEQFFFLTGAIVGGVNVLDQRLEFKHSKRSIVGVVGNQADTHRLLIKLEQYGHRLLAHFHSHPGNGPEATRPSCTDTGFQKRLEDAGYPSVAAIFSRDGYIRFFRLDDDLEVEIYGSGVEQHDKNNFRITAIS